MSAQYPAVFTVHTPGGPTDCCLKHARAAMAIFRNMGVHVNAVKAPDNAECTNCVNEASRHPLDQGRKS